MLQRVLAGPGAAPTELRVAAAGREVELPEGVASLVRAIHDTPWAVTDELVQEAARSLGEDATFEVIVAAALGASRARLMSGLTALEDS